MFRHRAVGPLSESGNWGEAALQRRGCTRWTAVEYVLVVVLGVFGGCRGWGGWEVGYEDDSARIQAALDSSSVPPPPLFQSPRVRTSGQYANQPTPDDCRASAIFEVSSTGSTNQTYSLFRHPPTPVGMECLPCTPPPPNTKALSPPPRRQLQTRSSHHGVMPKPPPAAPETAHRIFGHFPMLGGGGGGLGTPISDCPPAFLPALRTQLVTKRGWVWPIVMVVPKGLGEYVRVYVGAPCPSRPRPPAGPPLPHLPAPKRPVPHFNGRWGSCVSNPGVPPPSRMGASYQSTW